MLPADGILRVSAQSTCESAQCVCTPYTYSSHQLRALQAFSGEGGTVNLQSHHHVVVQARLRMDFDFDQVSTIPQKKTRTVRKGCSAF